MLDTANKRLAAIAIGSPWRAVLPLPDGVLDAGDRAMVAGLAVRTLDTGGDVPPAMDPRQEFYVRETPDGYRFDDVYVDPEEHYPVALNLFDWCANFWRRNEMFDTDEYVRPVIGNGFAYRCASDGTSGWYEPRWPRVAGATVRDGSIVWTAVSAGNNGLNAISGPSGEPDPSGLEVSAVEVSESTKILATYGGGTEGGEYDVKFEFILAGRPRVARQRVIVQKR